MNRYKVITTTIQKEEISEHATASMVHQRSKEIKLSQIGLMIVLVFICCHRWRGGGGGWSWWLWRWWCWWWFTASSGSPTSTSWGSRASRRRSSSGRRGYVSRPQLILDSVWQSPVCRVREQPVQPADHHQLHHQRVHLLLQTPQLRAGPRLPSQHHHHHHRVLPHLQVNIIIIIFTQTVFSLTLLMKSPPIDKLTFKLSCYLARHRGA